MRCKIMITKHDLQAQFRSLKDSFAESPFQVIRMWYIPNVRMIVCNLDRLQINHRISLVLLYCN